MMAQSHPKLALRPYLAADAALLREIFRASIEQLTVDDYSQTQQQALRLKVLQHLKNARAQDR